MLGMTRPAWRRVPLANEQATIPVWPETGEIMGLSKASTYDAIARGDIPSIRIGRRIVVPTAGLRRLLQLDPTDSGDVVA